MAVKKKKVARKKAKRRKKPLPLIGEVSGQEGRVRISGSKLHLTRAPDRVIMKRPPKKQRFEKA